MVKKGHKLIPLVVMKDGTMFVKLFKGIRELSNEIVLTFKSDGMEFQGMDSSHVSMSRLLWHKDDFDMFNVSDKISLGISVENLNKCLTLLPQKGGIQLGMYENNDDVLNILMINNDGFECNLDLNLMCIDNEQLEVPEIEYPVSLVVGSSDFKTVIKNLQNMSEVLTFSTNQDGKLQLDYKGDICEGEQVIAVKESGIGKHDISVTMSTRYIRMFAEFDFCGPNTNIYMGENIPMKLSFVFKSKSRIEFYLAPKVED